MARVLVVDDEERIRSSVRRMLAYHKHEVVEAEDGNTAIALARAGGYDVALVDYRMPGGPNGDVVLRNLRDFDPACARVLMTATDEAEVWRTAVNDANIAYTLPKPFDEAMLLKAVNKALEATADVRKHHRLGHAVLAARRDWRECVDKGLLRLDVQPIVEARDPRCVRALECLIRSRHPVLSRPDLLLSAVEATGGVFELGAVVNALAAGWAAQIPPDVLLFVNVHPAQFADPRLLESFAPLLPYASRVVLEITERADLQETTDWERQIDALTDAGFQFAVDDLGAGHNTLALLAELRPTFIKIDMSIIRGIHLKQRKQSLVDLIVKFAAANGEQVVAEGVETPEEAEALVRCGVELLQGYLFGRPANEWPTPASGPLRMRTAAR
jgi:EAL domain-containing protein (putative c-di-GMP-specific phosphodiesterase class I)/CheY-like chemotaxis protein